MKVEVAVVDVVECCFTSTESVGLLGTGAQDAHLDFHTALELCHVEHYIQWAYCTLSTGRVGCFPLRQLMPTQLKPLHSNGLLHTLYWQSGVVFCST